MNYEEHEIKKQPSYKEEIENLFPFCKILEIAAGDSKLAVAPNLQGRVLTSCINPNLEGFGWINHKLIQSRKSQPHINAFGGEDRFWIGPEAGQYAIFFKPGEEFTFDNWQTPACIDAEPFDVVAHKQDSLLLYKSCQLTNYQGFEFEIEINRKIRIYDASMVEELLNDVNFEKVDHVSFSSSNAIKNIANQAWHRTTGLLNIWILGKFKPYATCWALVPTEKNAVVNENYFYANLDGRLKQNANTIAFKVDGTLKAKIGIAPTHDQNLVGSFDFETNTLTVVKYETDKSHVFLNSEWNIQEKPYAGDVINIYNDGPNTDGSILGPYYELETSSSSKELRTGESIYHKHTTHHFTGDYNELNKIAKQLLNCDLEAVKNLIHGE